MYKVAKNLATVLGYFETSFSKNLKTGETTFWAAFE